MFGGTLPGIKWITWSWSQIGGSPLGVSNTLEWLSKTFLRSTEIDDFDVGTSSEHNCAITPHFYFFRSFVMTLELIILPGFPAIPRNSTSFPSEKNFKKSSWKLKATVPKDCNHCTPSTTSAPPIGMERIGLVNTYSPMVSLILWHFPEQFIVPPFATITWHSGVGYKKQFNSLATLQWIKLWVLLESINTITFFFLICHSILRVWGVVIPTNALHDMLGLISSSSRVSSWCISSSFEVPYSFSSSSSQSM